MPNNKFYLTIVVCFFLTGCATTTTQPFQALSKGARVGVISQFNTPMEVPSSQIFSVKKRMIHSSLNTYSNQYMTLMLHKMGYQAVSLTTPSTREPVINSWSWEGNAELSPNWKNYIESQAVAKHLEGVVIIHANSSSAICTVSNEQINLNFDVYYVKTHPLSLQSNQTSSMAIATNCKDVNVADYGHLLDQAVGRINDNVSNQVISVLQSNFGG